MRPTTLTAVAVPTIALAVAANAQGPVFTNVTAAAGITSVHVPTHLESRAAGGAVGDFDRDGWLDVFHCVGGGAPDRLFINNRNGTFTDRAAAFGVAVAHMGTGAIALDFDRDGWLDLYVASLGTTFERPDVNLLYRNVGGTRFVNVAVAMGVNSNGTAPDSWTGAVGDYDLDGDLDLAVAGWRSGQNRLNRNNGGTSFTNASASSGVIASLLTSSGSCARFVDLDGDRYPELVFIADFGTSRYFRNNGNGTFTGLAAAGSIGTGTTDKACAIADFDEDGRFDIFVRGQGINRLQMNQGGNVFTNVAATPGVQSAGIGWGTVAADFDNDGLVDIFVTTQTGPYYLFRNTSAAPAVPTFTNVTAAAGITTTTSGRAVANFDYDNDGDQDLLLFPHSASLVLYRNDTPAVNANWLSVVLDHGGASGIAPDGIGAVVRATVGARTWSRLIDGGSNYLSNSELRAHFGLGAATTVDLVRVEWPDGQVSTLGPVAANQRLQVRAPANAPSVTSIGAGCAGSNGVPNLAARTQPRLGTTFTIDVTSLTLNGGPAALVLSFGRQLPALDLSPLGAPSCLGHVVLAGATTVFLVNSGGTSSFSMAIPNVPAFAGTTFYVQGASFDPPANLLGIAVPNALQVVVF